MLKFHALKRQAHLRAREQAEQTPTDQKTPPVIMLLQSLQPRVLFNRQQRNQIGQRRRIIR